MQRMGRTHRPFYRINAVDSHNPRDGRVIERLGWYDPITTDNKVELNEERIKYWLSVGAQPSDTVRDMLGHRDLLPAKAKAKWESDRKTARERVETKKAAEAAASEESSD